MPGITVQTNNVIVSFSDGSEIGAGITYDSISSLSTTFAFREDVFQFTVTDDANPSIVDDSVSTFISQIVINPGGGNDFTDWRQIIAGARLWDGSTEIVGGVNATNAGAEVRRRVGRIKL